MTRITFRSVAALLLACALSPALAGGAAGPLPVARPAMTAVQPATRAVQVGDLWEGTYVCSETAGVRFRVSEVSASTLGGKLEFYPLSSASRWPYGAVQTSGRVRGPVFELTRATWLVQPAGFALPDRLQFAFSRGGEVLDVNFVGNTVGCLTATLRRLP
jgi:hypothetical protein